MSILRGLCSKLISLLVAIAFIPALCLAQSDSTATVPKDDPERQRAFELYDEGKFVEAFPLYEKLAADSPSDLVVKEGYAWCMLQISGTVQDSEERKKLRARARAIAVEANKLGDNSQILRVMLELPEDGTEPSFSNRKEVDETMKAAEADFSRGDFDKAREGYLRALVLDPSNYSAALFIGDVYFKQHQNGSAGEWFSRAIQIDPDRETAYRYWGDALVALGKEDEARSKFIDAIVAEPYKQRSWFGLTNWLKRNKLELNNVRLQEHSSVTVKDEKNINITLDSSLGANDPNSLAWTTYGIGRAAWHTEASEKEFPNITRKRRTLQEEVQALQLMVTVLKEQKDYAKKLKALEPSLQSLIRIQELGFLEPFVLINRADSEIAEDYESYRVANREKIRRYFDEFLVPKTPTQTK